MKASMITRVVALYGAYRNVRRASRVSRKVAISVNVSAASATGIQRSVMPQDDAW